MARKRKRRKHSPEVISKIVNLCASGVRSKDIYKQSKELFGYVIKQSSISNILHANGMAFKIKENTFTEEYIRKPKRAKKALNRKIAREERKLRKTEKESQEIVEDGGDFENENEENDLEEDLSYSEDEDLDNLQEEADDLSEIESEEIE